MKEDLYCIVCNLYIARSVFGMGAPQGYRFEDGWRCPKCAKIYIEYKRKR